MTTSNSCPLILAVVSLPSVLLAAESPPLAAVPGEPTLTAPQGVEVKVVADEKGQKIESPTALTFDEKGAIYVAETLRFRFGVEDNRDHLYWYLDDLAARTIEDRRALHEKWKAKVPLEKLTEKSERITKLSEPGADGVFGRSEVYADDFRDLLDGTAAGVFEMDGTVYFACIPKIWMLRDEDGDGKAESRKVMMDGFGPRISYSGHDLNGFALGPDGRIYGTVGDRGFTVTTKEGVKIESPDRGAVFRFEPDGSRFEVLHTGLRNPKEIAFDECGNAITVDNNSDQGDKARVVYVMEGGDSGWEMGHQALNNFHRQIGMEERPPNRWMVERMWEPENDAQPAYQLPPVANLTNGPSGLTYYPGTGYQESEAGRFLICDYKGSSAASGIYSFRVEPQGAGMKLTDSRQAVWGLAATDVEYGWDGRLYITDFIGGWQSHNRGRVLRLDAGKETYRSGQVEGVMKRVAEGFGNLDSEALAGLLKHPDMRIRVRAELALTRKPDALQRFEKAVASADVHERLHGVWGLGVIARRGAAMPVQSSKGEFVALPDRGLQRKAGEALVKLLGHADAETRAQAVKALGEAPLAGENLPLGKLLIDESKRVRGFAAIAIGRLKSQGLIPQIWEMLDENADQDPYLRHAGAYALALLAKEPRQLSALAAHQSVHVRLAAVVALRRLKSPEVARFLGDADAKVVDEAVRAIHDEAIEGARPMVAALLDDPAAAKRSPFQLRRLLHSAFRLDGLENAKRLLKVASTAEFPLESRREAIRLLSIWPEPPLVDQSLGRVAPLPKRDLSVIREALIAGIPMLLKQEDTLAEGLALVERFKLPIDGLDDASVRAMVGRSQLRGEARAVALRLYASRNQPDLKEVLASLAGDKSEVLAIDSLKLLAERFPEQAVKPLLAATEGSVNRAQTAWKLLEKIQSAEIAPELVKALQGLKEKSGVSPVALEVLAAAKAHTEPAVVQALADYEKSVKESKDPLAPYLASLEGGDATRGATLFASHPVSECMRCHRAEITGDSGGEAGPNLYGVATRGDRRYLLESVVTPSAKVTPGFGVVSLTFPNGATLAGRVLGESAEWVDLDAGGKAWRVMRKDAKEITPVVSAMPPMGLLLKPEEVRDVVAWLSTLNKKGPGVKPYAAPPVLDPKTLKS